MASCGARVAWWDSAVTLHVSTIPMLQHELHLAKISPTLTSQRLHVFLFSELLILTRPVTRGDRSCFQVSRQPIPVRDLALEDLLDGEIRMGGSFRGAFTNGERGGLSWVFTCWLRVCSGSGLLMYFLRRFVSLVIQWRCPTFTDMTCSYTSDFATFLVLIHSKILANN